MPPKAAKAGGPLSEKEKDILSLAWMHFKEAPPKVNYATLAQALGYTNQGSVQNALAAAIKKLKAMPADPNGAGEASSTPATPATPVTPVKGKGKKRKAADDEGADADADEAEAPPTAPKKRGRKPAATKGKAAVVRDEADELSHEKGESTEADGLI
ncbi:hypothetical protein F5Y08DRAFT_354760 [Xylaria arbuscula]|nr:hypothetical protein F5Y08DRAFT_354760 [Xylaria arbuscula]